MADQPEDSAQRQNAGLPLPPPFYHDFTPDKLARYQAIVASRADRDGTDGTAPGQTRIPLTELPEDLINLQPPPPPENGEWRCFGDRYTLRDELPTLEEQSIERLVPEGIFSDGLDDKQLNREVILKRCAKSLLLNFFEMIVLMRKDPWAGQDKSADLRTLFINFHHAINEYRPHQARESLIQLMQDQLDRKRAETQANREAADKAKRVLEGLASIKIPDDKTLFPPLYPDYPDYQVGAGSKDKEMEEDVGWKYDWDAWKAIDDVI